MKFVDQLDNELILSAYPKRIISLVPSLTELLFELGLDKEVVGVTDYCIFPTDNVSDRPKIGGPKQFNFPLIDFLKPDLLIGNREENYQSGITRLQEKYPVWMSDIVTLEDMLKMIREIGAITGCSIKADEISEKISHSISTLPHFKPLRAAYLIWNDPLMVAAGDTFINEMMRKCGFENIFACLSRYPVIDPGELARAEIILLSTEPYPFSEKDIDHFQHKHPGSMVKIVDAAKFSWYGSHILHSADYFVQLRESIDN